MHRDMFFYCSLSSLLVCQLFIRTVHVLCSEFSHACGCTQLYNDLITASRFSVGGISWTNVQLPNPSSCPPRSSSSIYGGCIIQTVTTACEW